MIKHYLNKQQHLLRELQNNPTLLFEEKIILWNICSMPATG